MENISQLLINFWWLGLLLLGFVLFLYLKKLAKTFGGDAIEIKADQVAKLVEEDQATMIDLAEKMTFEKGHIPGAVNMPGITFIDGSVGELDDKTKPVILIPMKGLIPMPVIEYLNDAGVAEVYIFKGGLKEWKDSGLPL